MKAFDIKSHNKKKNQYLFWNLKYNLYYKHSTHDSQSP